MTQTTNPQADTAQRAATRAIAAALTLPEGVTVTPFTPDSQISFHVRRYGIEIGTIAIGQRSSTMLPTGARFATYRFATAQDAVDAVISYERNGYWRNEI